MDVRIAIVASDFIPLTHSLPICAATLEWDHFCVNGKVVLAHLIGLLT